MKHVLIIIAILMASGFYACNKPVLPEKVEKSFNEKFSEATSVKWEMEAEKEWEAEFKMDGQKISAVFDNDGKWLETEKAVDKKQIPETVSATLERAFKDYKIEEIEWLETPEYTGYEVKLETEETEVEVLMDESGQILKKEVINEEAEEDGEESGELEEQEQTINSIGYTDDFNIADYTFSTTGRNAFFILEPSYQLVLEGKEDNETARLEITILDETKMIGNIETRIMEEREMENDELIEISRNFVAFCIETSDIFYFGEEVDIYEDGDIKNHEGAWRADEANCKAGILMPGRIILGARYYQELAPGKAMDRAEIISTTETMDTPAGLFAACLKTLETSDLNPKEKEFKFYAPGIGLIKEENLKLIKYGFFR